MAGIHVLDPHLAAKIAAGEVIERPASVVKELVENALDAGATWVRVEIEEGGMRRISVADDGCGIAADEVELAFRRHATSKLRSEEDLNELRTLGFRGEALPSIAAVADVTCTTRAAGARVGTRFQVQEGALETSAIARQPGTTLDVENLFARFPARRKFLRSRAVEAAACVQAVAPLALAFPAVRFTVEVDGRTALRTPGTGALADAAAAVLGAEAAQSLVAVPRTEVEDDDGRVVVGVSGTCATGAYHRSNRSGIHLLVNHRPIQNRLLSYAVVEAYGSLIPTGRQPVAVVEVEVPPSEVDFNVHPSKLEVKLLRERLVYGSLQRALRAALGGEAWDVAGWAPAGETGEPSGPSGPATADLFRGADWQALAAAGSAPAGEHHGDLLEGGERLEDLRLVGQVGRMYVVAEGDAGLYLVDQHAAHERVLLEEIESRLDERGEKQLLLEPAVVGVGAEGVALVEAAAADLVRLGFDVAPFGPREVLVRAVPATIAQRSPERIVQETLVALAGNTHGLAVEQQAPWTRRLALVLACKTAVRAGDALSPAEMQRLLARLGEARLCRTCAHGRPTAILLSHAQLEKEFGRR